MNAAVTYLEMPAKDLAATKRFYTAVFDWAFEDFGDQYTVVQQAGLSGGFYQSDKVMRCQSGSALVVLYCEQLSVVKEKILVHGGMILQDVFSFPGGFRFHFLDTNGNELAVWSQEDL